MSGWRVWGEPFYTSHFSGAPVYYQPFVLNFLKATVLRGVQTQFINYNSPSFTSFEGRIYSNLGGSPGKLLFTSTNTQLPGIFTAANGVMTVFFNFDLPLDLNPFDTYHFVPWGNGYTGTSSSHVAWKKSFPDPACAVTVTDMNKIGVWPYDFEPIGAYL